MIIYEPTGKAREYSPLAANIFKGCDHGCTYCYVPSCLKRSGANLNPELRKGFLNNLERELKKAVPTKQILLCFLCDPYPIHDVAPAITRQALEIFLKYGCKVVILSKGGRRVLRDLDVIKRFPAGTIKYGVTLTFMDDALRRQYEPAAASVSERLDVLGILKDAGITTFASIEPVMDPVESLRVIEASLPVVDQYKVGKLNHNKELEAKIDWAKFLMDALALIRPMNKGLYIKEDLRKEASVVSLRKSEMGMDFLCL